MQTGLAQAPAPGTIRVEITAEGHDFESAKNEALRQAVQKALPQLVIADRRIENDQVALDRVQSSLNGHVQNLTILNASRSGTGMRVTIAADVSRTPLHNFVLPSNSPLPRISGQAIVAEQQVEAQARPFREDYVRHLLQGFPARHIQVRVDAITPTHDGSNALVMQVSYQLNAAFLHELRKGLREIACKFQTPGDCSNTAICFDLATGPECIALAQGKPGHEYAALHEIFLSRPHSHLRRNNAPGAQDREFHFTLLFNMLDTRGRRLGQRPCFDFGFRLDFQPSRKTTVPYSNIQNASHERAIDKTLASLNLSHLGGGTHWFTDRSTSIVFDVPANVLRGIDLAQLNAIEGFASLESLAEKPTVGSYRDIVLDITEPAVRRISRSAVSNGGRGCENASSGGRT